MSNLYEGFNPMRFKVRMELVEKALRLFGETRTLQEVDSSDYHLAHYRDEEFLSKFHCWVISRADPSREVYWVQTAFTETEPVLQWSGLQHIYESVWGLVN